MRMICRRLLPVAVRLATNARVRGPQSADVGDHQQRVAGRAAAAPEHPAAEPPTPSAKIIVMAGG
jgi:hypothetical protein